MRPDPEMKLLELSRGGRAVAVDEFADQLHVSVHVANRILSRLLSNDLVHVESGSVQLDAHRRTILAEKLIHSGHDPRRVARLLGWQEFEDFAVYSLRENGFRTVKHLVLKTKLGRREIDLVAWNENFLLSVDCKHWMRGLTPSRVLKAARAQVERTILLAKNTALLSKHGIGNLERRSIMPAILTLGEPREKIVEGVPVIAVSNLVSFIYGVSPLDERLKRIPIRSLDHQSILR